MDMIDINVPEGMKVTSNEKLKNIIIKGLGIKGGHCPCIIEKSDDTLCPCKKVREIQECCCGLFEKKK